MSMLDKFSLKDRVIVVIGGKGVYGVELTKSLAELGAIVYDGARNLEELEEITKPMRDAGLKVIPAYCDFSKEDTLIALRDRILKEQGRIDGLVVNAVTRGLLKGGWNCTIESFGESMKVNDGMPDFVLERIYDIMRENGVTDISRVGLYGLTYKENVDDMRQSPTLQLLDSQARHLAEGLKVYDPFVTRDVVKNQYHDLDAFLRCVDIVVVMVGHDEIKKNQSLLDGKIVFDTRNVITLPGVYHI